MREVETYGEQDLFGIAIIGMAGRFPGANDVDEFWKNLREGVESIRPFTAEELAASGIDEETTQNRRFVNAGAPMPGADSFDAAFFDVNAREAEIMDPQHRVFLETAWEALEDAGYDPHRYPGSIGVFGGVGPNTYLQKNLSTRPEVLQLLGRYAILLASEKEYAVTRVSFKLNLTGPSFSVSTACSTSGVTVHVACQSLLSGECDMALAGGGRINVPLTGGYFYEEGGILSPDGHCRAFDASARGTVGGNGVGLVVLKRLAEAVEDGDHIYAVIKGSAINNDGALKVGFTAPSVQGQAAVIREALALADIDPNTIGYVEAHGTGTPLGDPIEIAALTEAYRQWTDRKGYCPIGSAKTNIGHLDAGAGVAGLIKAVLALHHEEIPPSLHFEHPNPELDLANSPFYVNTDLAPWPAANGPRRAAVSSFGLGGTNAHIVLEEAPRTEPSGPSRAHQLLVWSARSDAALSHATENLAAHLEQHPDINLADVAYTLQTGRQPLDRRRMLVCRDIEDALTALDPLDPKRVITSTHEPRERDVVFMFSGQGAQYVNMGRDLYDREPAFRQEVDRCCEILMPHLSSDLRQILYPPDVDQEEAAQTLRQTAFTQPALFVIEYALARLWLSWGIQPTAMVGHSIGEYVAACLAGVFSLEDALSLVAARGRLMQDLPSGSMLAVQLSPDDLRPLLDGKLDLAVINAPTLCVVSGEHDAVEAFQNELDGQGVGYRLLHTSHAFHSRMMEPIVDVFTARVNRAKPQPPSMPFVSNVTGTWIGPDDATSPTYWAAHLRQSVRFSDNLEELLKEPNRVLLEVGPGRTLEMLAKQHPAKTRDHVILSSTRHPKEQKPDDAAILSTAGQLWMAGVSLDWSRFYVEERRHRLPLPTYPFERKRYWIEPAQLQYSAAATAPGASVDDGEISSQHLRRRAQRRNGTDHCHDLARSARSATGQGLRRLFRSGW
jgi:phthiocerol/phenolphthiocerol synthesis type-I polyketide synthase E